MSANNIIIKTAFAVVATAGLTLTAYAGNNSSRYGGPSVYDYESGGKCKPAACAPVAQQGVDSRYGAPAQVQYQGYQSSLPVSPGVVYVDCAAMGTCAPQPQYQQPVQHSQQNYTTQSYSAPAANCPTGTTMQANGTCMQSSFGSTPTYSSDTSYSSTSSFGGETVPCPSGTTSQPDGTCMQTGSSFGSSSSFSSSSSYSSGSSFGSTMTSSAPANCPAGTTAQSDGTCMQGGSVSAFTGGTATLFTGDATPSTPSYGGYTSDGSYSANSYLPIRK